MSAPTVVLADDHAPVRRGVRQALQDGGLEVVAEAGDTDGAVQAAVEHRPDVCLLDVHMPGGGGAVAAARILDAVDETVVVMLSASSEDDDLLQALRAGASGYLLKDMDPDRLAHALRGVLAGEAAMPRHLVSRLVTEFQDRERTRELPGLRRGVVLSDREREVLRMLGDELSTAAMAERMGVSPVTVRRHVSGVLAKLDAPSREAAVALVRARSTR